MSLNLIYKQNGVFQKDMPRLHESCFVGMTPEQIQQTFIIEGYDYEIVDIDTLNELLNAKSDAELLAEAKQNKLVELEQAYNQAQVVKFINGATFYLGIKTATGLDDFRNAVNDAKTFGSSWVKVQDINGLLHEGYVPYFLLLEFKKIIDTKRQDTANVPTLGISQHNYNLYVNAQLQIAVTSSLEELNAIDLNVFTSNYEININTICDALYAHENTTIDNKAYLESIRTPVLNENNELDHYTYNLFIN